MITIEETSGGFIAVALVRDNKTPFDWYERQMFIGYKRREIKPLFRARLKELGMKIVKDVN